MWTGCAEAVAGWHVDNDAESSTRQQKQPASKMRIGCLQFAPQVADIDNNLNRADAVLAKANQDDLDSLDLLVLPEMAFSGMVYALETLKIKRMMYSTLQDSQIANHSLFPQATISGPYKISHHTWSHPAPASVRCGPGQLHSSTTPMSWLGILRKSMCHLIGQLGQSTTIQRFLSTATEKPWPTIESHSSTPWTRPGRLRASTASLANTSRDWATWP